MLSTHYNLDFWDEPLPMITLRRSLRATLAQRGGLPVAALPRSPRAPRRAALPAGLRVRSARNIRTRT